jgi:hypothetical protein
VYILLEEQWKDWVNAGSSSIWTQAVKSVIIKWDGAS